MTDWLVHIKLIKRSPLFFNWRAREEEKKTAEHKLAEEIKKGKEVEEQRKELEVKLLKEKEEAEKLKEDSIALK